jgi:hypothetical protein
MLEMYDFTILQVRYIKSAMDEIATYRPDYKTPSDVTAMLPSPDTVRSDYVTKKMLASGTRDAVQEQLNRLITRDETFAQCVTRGDQTSALWGTLPQVGTPPAAFSIRRSEGDLTKAQFDTLLTNARTADVALPPADQDFQHAEGDLHVKHHNLEDFVTAALAQGRSQFAEGTAEREVINAIPAEPAQNIPGQAVISSAVLVDGTHAKLIFDAPNATSFDVLYQSPAEEPYHVVAEDIIEREFIADVVTGENNFKVVGRNSRGNGPESDVTDVTA